MIDWLLYSVPVQRWEFIVLFIFIGIILVLMFVLEWKYYGVKFKDRD